MTSWSRVSSRQRARLRRLVFTEKGTTCWAPGCHDRATTVDHVTPCAAGGTHTVANLEPCCAKHNSSRQDTPVHQWLATLTRPAPAAPSRPW